MRILLYLAGIVCAFGAFAQAPWPKAAPVDLSKLSPDQFSDSELDMPYLLAHFHEVANSIVETGENRGFIDINVWRAERDNKPYNARILENYLSIAWFYCAKRPWNVYHGDPAVRARLEALLEFWCNKQAPDGKFSEYADNAWSLAPTAFATKFMGRTLELLESGPPIDAELLARVIAAERKAILITLTDEALFEHGRVYSNQFTNVWPGALAYLKLHPDPEIERLFRQRLTETISVFQSPAGYFYEKNGPDWSYNFGTHHTNLEAARHYASDPALDAIFNEKVRRFYDWVGYNAVLEPNGKNFILNRAVETRNHVTHISCERIPLFDRTYAFPDTVEMARPFSPTQEELAAFRKQSRAELERNWPKVPALDEFTPYMFLAREFERTYPTEAERAAAMAKLPYLAREEFTHQRVDDRCAVAFTYIRRPSYYAACTTGDIYPSTVYPRFGLGLVWNPAMGTVLQSQTSGKDTAWGTMPAGEEYVCEAQDLDGPSVEIEGNVIKQSPGIRDLPPGDAVIRYGLKNKLGAAGTKRLAFTNAGVEVAVELPGEFTENLPLLALNGVAPSLEKNRLLLEGGGVTFRIAFSNATPRLKKTGATFAGRTLWLLQLGGESNLEYTLRFGPAG